MFRAVLGRRADMGKADLKATVQDWSSPFVLNFEWEPLWTSRAFKVIEPLFEEAVFRYSSTLAPVSNDLNARRLHLEKYSVSCLAGTGWFRLVLCRAALVRVRNCVYFFFCLAREGMCKRVRNCASSVDDGYSALLCYIKK